MILILDSAILLFGNVIFQSSTFVAFHFPRKELLFPKIFKFKLFGANGSTVLGTSAAKQQVPLSPLKDRLATVEQARSPLLFIRFVDLLIAAVIAYAGVLRLIRVLFSTTTSRCLNRF